MPLGNCLVCDSRDGTVFAPTRNFCSPDCRNAFRANPDIFQGFGVPTGRKAAAARRRGLDPSAPDRTADAKNPYEMGSENGVEARSSVAFMGAPPVGLWPDRQGRTWRWEQESAPGLDPGDDWLLLDRDGRLAVHLNRQSSGWRIVYPRTIPAIIEPGSRCRQDARSIHRSRCPAASPIDPPGQRKGQPVALWRPPVGLAAPAAGTAQDRAS
jgi:hypothetical protein